LISFPTISGKSKYIPIKVEQKEQIPQLTKENFIKELDNLNFKKYSDLAIAQATLESGFGQSPLYKVTNNLFGITTNGKGYKVVIEGKTYIFAIYPDWRYSLKEWTEWMDKWYTSNQKVLRAISPNYCPEITYINKINQLLNQNVK
jgi:flagellum-specific peptidoglycan hydrolase FlgJ